MQLPLSRMQPDWKSLFWLSVAWSQMFFFSTFWTAAGWVETLRSQFYCWFSYDCWWLLAQIKSYAAQFDYVGILTNWAGTQCATNEFIKTAFLNFLHIKYKFIKFGLYLFCVCILLFVAPIFVLAFMFLLMHLGKNQSWKFLESFFYNNTRLLYKFNYIKKM